MGKTQPYNKNPGILKSFWIHEDLIMQWVDNNFETKFCYYDFSLYLYLSHSVIVNHQLLVLCNIWMEHSNTAGLVF